MRITFRFYFIFGKNKNFCYNKIAGIVLLREWINFTMHPENNTSNNGVMIV